MDLFQCLKCNKTFKKKYILQSHQNKKYDCVSGELVIKENIINEPSNSSIECLYCLKKLSRSDNLERHYKSCKIKRENYENYEKLKKETDELKKNIEELKINNQTINNITINNNIIQNNIQNNVQFNDYGMEDLSKINLHEILEKKADVIPKFLYELHCSIDRPENHNVGVKDTRRYQAFIKKNGEWIETNKKKILNELLNKITSHIGIKHLEDCNKLGLKETELLYKNALREIKNIDPNEDRYEKNKHNETLQTIEHVLYVNKDRIFSDVGPSIKKRINYKSTKRPEFIKPDEKIEKINP
jgi:hypothetical protein